MNNISEFDICTYRNTVVFELSTEDIEPEAHARMIDILHDVIQNEFADNIRKRFDESLTEDHCYECQRVGRL